jgi:hypothetical protein
MSPINLILLKSIINSSESNLFNKIKAVDQLKCKMLIEIVKIKDKDDQVIKKIVMMSLIYKV